MTIIPNRLVGQRLGKYSVVRGLGEGSAAEVYLARDNILDLDVALKVLKPGEDVRRLRLEGQVMFRLEHQGILQVKAMEEVGEERFLVMTYLDGRTLDSHLRERGRLPEGEAVAIALSLARALEYAHGHRVLHRDLKPENIMLGGQGEVKVMDFGLAKDLSPSERASMTQQGMLGTPAYMAPEQLKGERATEKSDIYSLGLILFEMLSGRPAFERVSRDSVVEFMAERLRMGVPDIEAVNGRVPRWLSEVVRRSTAHSPQDRLSSAREMRRLLELGGSEFEAFDPTRTRMPQPQERVAVSQGREEARPQARVDAVMAKTEGGVSLEGEGRRAWTRLVGLMGVGLLVVAAWQFAPLLWRSMEEGEEESPSAEIQPINFPIGVVRDGGSVLPILRALKPLEPEVTLNSLAMELVRIPAGSFTMGSPFTEAQRSEEETIHTVEITRPFLLGRNEVTQGQWSKIMESNPSGFPSCGQSCPVENVTWQEAAEFCNRVSEKEGLEKCYRLGGILSIWDKECRGYRLPTESEWEYVARAGTLTPFSTGSCLSTEEANYDGAYPYTGCEAGLNARSPLSVSSFSPNPWGLYDMHGNVAEWVWDWHDGYPLGAERDPQGLLIGQERVIRGGSWFHTEAFCRSAVRIKGNPRHRQTYVGFRVARTQ